MHNGWFGVDCTVRLLVVFGLLSWRDWQGAEWCTDERADNA